MVYTMHAFIIVNFVSYPNKNVAVYTYFKHVHEAYLTDIHINLSW